VLFTYVKCVFLSRKTEISSCRISVKKACDWSPVITEIFLYFSILGKLVSLMGGIIVVGDTHFGITKDSISMPGQFSDFLKYIRGMDEEKVRMYDGVISEKHLESPEKIILLGDIVELWDSCDEAVTFCVSSLIPTLSEMDAEIVYVLGNHDNILNKAVLSDFKDYYCFGESNVHLVEDIYPPEGFLPVGNENYVFVHGHQFDKWFRRTGNLHKLLSHLRTASNALTLYVPLLFGASLVSLLLNEAGIVFFPLGDVRIVSLLFLLTIPWICTSLARRIWNYCFGVKYKKYETMRNFTKWWKKAFKDIKVPENINVVYGHTHYLNFLLQEENIKKREDILEFLQEFLKGWETEELSFTELYNRWLRKEKIEEKPTLVNISAWVKDLKGTEKDEKYKNVMVASFLYIDEEGCEFFGWDWYEKRIFHIPKLAIIQRRDLKCVDEKMAGALLELGWPEKLVTKWKIPFSL
jgi:UDP-2,3-diacylglucosamine pyrophosphatase LpxH